ncbi:TetR/AcrR family transcriptional regulator [Nocardia sp. NPDC057353]|uniref:TetR/AcrR family transcriptional regulator n=1 Tax=Nocardia sp. NPDC057353 TaxID=3346104 RepID=UPI0036259C05
MPRPRLHDLDDLMDVAERMAVEAGPAAVTVRALSQTAGISNGAIYHAFGSRTVLLARVWLRAAQRFLALQREAVASASGSAVEAVVAAADAPALFLQRQPVSARFLLAVARAELIDGDIPDDLAAELRGQDQVLTELFVALARAVFDRADREAVAVIRDCVVELPTALLLRGNRAPDPPVRERLAAAVRAILALTPPTTT